MNTPLDPDPPDAARPAPSLPFPTFSEVPESNMLVGAWGPSLPVWAAAALLRTVLDRIGLFDQAWQVAPLAGPLPHLTRAAATLVLAIPLHADIMVPPCSTLHLMITACRVTLQFAAQRLATLGYHTQATVSLAGNPSSSALDFRLPVTPEYHIPSHSRPRLSRNSAD